MRELTKKEQELLIGGIDTRDMDAIEVQGFYYDFGWGFELWNDPFTYYYDADPNSGDGGSSGGGGDPQSCQSGDPATQAAYVDQLASKIARDIIAKPNHNSVEYLGIVYRDSDGVIRSTDLFTAGSDRVSIDFQSLGFPVSNIIALVHNHDAAHYGGSWYMVDANRNPSAADWATADAVVANGADSSTLALYVLDTQDAFRQYDYADKSRYLRNGAVTPDTPLGTTTSKTLEPDTCSV